MTLFYVFPARKSSAAPAQFTAPYHEEHIANRQLGTVERIDAEGNLQIRMDSGLAVRLSVRQHPHLDYGYAVGSHSSQGATAERVMVHAASLRAGRRGGRSHRNANALPVNGSRYAAMSARPSPDGVSARGRAKEIEELAESFAAVRDPELFFGREFGESFAERGKEEVRVVAEAT